MVAYLPKWYKVDELMQLVHLVRCSAPGYPEVLDYPLMWVDVPLMDLKLYHDSASGPRLLFSVFCTGSRAGLYRGKGLYVDE